MTIQDSKVIGMKIGIYFTMKNGLSKSFLLYTSSRLKSVSQSFLPAAFAIACPAAVSHSMVGPKRGYSLATPSATIHIFSELPFERILTCPNSFSRISKNFWVAWLACDLLPTMVNSTLFFSAGSFFPASFICLKEISFSTFCTFHAPDHISPTKSDLLTGT